MRLGKAQTKMSGAHPIKHRATSLTPTFVKTLTPFSLAVVGLLFALAVGARSEPANQQQLQQLGTVEAGLLYTSNSWAVGINNLGEAVGTSQISGYLNSEVFSFISFRGMFTSLSPRSFATSINNVGQITGMTHDGNNWNGFIYYRGITTNFNAIFSYANDINSRGVAVGVGALTDRDRVRALMYSSGALTELGTLGGRYSAAYGINDSGHVVGNSYLAGDVADRAFLYANGVMTDLSTLGGRDSWAEKINASGQVTGSSQIRGNTFIHPFLWQAGKMIDLGTIPGDDMSRGYGINSSGQVVGVSFDSSNPDLNMYNAFIYSDGRLFNLNDVYEHLLSDGTTEGFIRLREANAINDSGQVVGNGIYFDGIRYSTRAYMLNVSRRDLR